MDATRSPETDQRLVFRVVHHDSVSGTRVLSGRRKEPLEVALGEPAAEPTCDEDRLALVRHAAPPSSSIVAAIADFRASCGAPGMGKAAGSTRIARAPRGAKLSEGPGQRKAERVPNRGRDVDNVLGRRRRPENDVIVPGRHQDDARAGEQRNAAHGSTMRRFIASANSIARKSLKAAASRRLCLG